MGSLKLNKSTRKRNCDRQTVTLIITPNYITVLYQPTYEKVYQTVYQTEQKVTLCSPSPCAHQTPGEKKGVQPYYHEIHIQELCSTSMH